MKGDRKIWIASFEVQGEMFEIPFSQKTAEFARTLAYKPKLVDRLGTETMTLKKKGDRDENL